MKVGLSVGLYKEYLLDDISAGAFFATINYRELQGVMVDPHWHDYYEILYIQEGEVEQIIDNTRETLHQGDITVIAPGKVHATTSITDHCNVVVVLFMPNSFQDGVLSFDSGFLKCPYECEKEMQQIFYKINQEFNLRQNGYKNIAKGYIYEILGYLERNSNFVLDKNETIDIEIVNICKYIDENIEKPLFLAEVAEIAGYSPSYFSKYFRKMTGQTFKNYLDHVKMLKAKRMILFEGYSVNLTATKLGYEDASTFCRAFKRLNGYSPSALVLKKTKNV